MSTVTKIANAGQPQAGTIHWLNECIARGASEVFTETVTVTPGLAAELLRRNDSNRGIRIVKSAQYAADMRAGRWVFNGEPILVSKTGDMNDGQHRMVGIVDANLSLPFLFVFGLTRESRVTVDQGAARTAADYLGMEGVANATVQASIVRVLIAYERNDRTSLTGIGYVTNAEVMKRVHADEDVAASAHFASANAKATRAFAPPAIIGFCHYILSEVSASEADEYMGQICRGEGLRCKDPAYTVRERLLSMEIRSREKRIHLIVRGWNAYRQGRNLSIAKIMGADNIPAVI